MKKTTSIFARLALAMLAFIGPIRLACLVGYRSRRVFVAFNEEPQLDDTPAGDLRAVNAIGFGKDWQMRCPFGDWPVRAYDPKDPTKEVEIIQRVDRAAADEMVAAFNSLGGKLARWFVGVPIYDRHPDAPGATGADATRHGAISKISADESGILLAANYAKSGRDLIESGKRPYHSEHWALVATNESVDGKPVYRPTALLSVGLVERPNIPLAALNEAKLVKCPHCEKEFDYAGQPETSAGVVACPECKKHVMQDGTAPKEVPDEVAAANERITTLEAQLAAANESVTAKQHAIDAAAAQIVKTTGELQAANEYAANWKKSATDMLPKLQAAEAATAEATRQLNAANEALATARKAHAAAVVDRAIFEGRLIAADREDTIGRLCAANCADAEVARVRDAKPVIKTSSSVGNLAARKVDAAAEARVLQAANEHHARHGGNFIETVIRLKREAGLT